MLKVLIIGSGGREHAIAWKLAQDSRIGRIYVAPGNGGTAELERVENLPLTDNRKLCEFARTHDIDLTVVGPEQPLVDGIVDLFEKEGLAIFGADQRAAQLEGSKSHAKAFMQKYGVKTAAYHTFDNMDNALAYLRDSRYPLVVKASGLAAGKGVIICQNRQEAEEAVRGIMGARRFGNAGEEIVIEDFLEGFEASILSFTDCRTILPMLSAKDHKTIGENNTGENTGGMGVVCPHPAFTDTHAQAFRRDILEPTLKGLQAEGHDFAGIIFFGLMINDEGVWLLEYNMRMGDPETQTVLPLMENSLLDPILAAIDRKLAQTTLRWHDRHAVCVVAASGGYPGEYKTGLPIEHLEQARFFSQVFIAGAQKNESQYLTSGGRVLNIIGTGATLEEARAAAYGGIGKIRFDGITYRRDIGA